MTFKPFPTEILPQPLRRFVEDGAKGIGCDASFIALPAIAACTGAIGNARRVLLRPAWSEPAVGWFAVVGDSGTLKTPAINLALAGLRRRQQLMLHEHANEMASYRGELSEWKSKPRGERGEEPDPPAPCRHLYVSDITIEALASRLETTPRGTLVAVDELAGWFGSFNAYKRGGGDVAHWLSMWGAGPLKVDRKTADKPTTYVAHAAVSIIGGIQPATLRRALSPELFDNGLASRLLIAWPPKCVARWNDSGMDEMSDLLFGEVIASLFEFQGTKDESTGSVKPSYVGLAPEAKARFVRFYDDHAQRLASLDGRRASMWSKIRGYAARLALVTHCIRQAAGESMDPWMMDEQSVETGVALSLWFGHEADRIYHAHSEGADQSAARELKRWIASRGGRVTERDLQRNLRHYGAEGAAEHALQQLVDAADGSWSHRGRTREFCLASSPEFRTGSADTSPENHWNSNEVSAHGGNGSEI